MRSPTGAEVPATPRRATITDDIAPDEMTPEMARELLEVAADDGKVLGKDPETGRDIVARAGRYGPYVTEVIEDDERRGRQAQGQEGRQGQAPHRLALQGHGARRRSTSTTRSSCCRCRASSAPTPRVSRSPRRTVATARTSRRARDSRSLTTEQQLFDITLEEALAIYAQPKQRGRAAATPPLKELGADPVSGKPVVVKDGRFGPYVTDGETNATLRKDDDPAAITPERGFELLAEKRAKGPTTRKRAVKKTAKKTAKKRRPRPKKATAKKA